MAPCFAWQGPANAADALIVSSSNEEAVGLLRQSRQWPGGALALIGPPGSGKSHIAAAWADRTGAALLYGLPDPTDAREAFRRANGRLALDGADVRADDVALTLLLDLARDERGAVLLLGRESPALWRVALPDLRSRLAALPVAQLGEPDDVLLRGMLRRLCKARFIELRDNVARYLAQHMERSFAAAHALAEALDQLMVKGSQPVSYEIARRALALVATPVAENVSGEEIE
jgi:chromosomal replication initiation ATPase DnaA